MNEKHWPVCSMGYPMVYWGAEKRRGCAKFRCPHICGQKDCLQGSAWCADSAYGYSLRLSQEKDPRNVSLPFRDSKNWKKIYKMRGAVERFFGYLKANLGAEQLHVRGTAKSNHTSVVMLRNSHGNQLSIALKNSEIAL